MTEALFFVSFLLTHSAELEDGVIVHRMLLKERGRFPEMISQVFADRYKPQELVGLWGFFSLTVPLVSLQVFTVSKVLAGLLRLRPHKNEGYSGFPTIRQYSPQFLEPSYLPQAVTSATLRVYMVVWISL